MRPLLSPRCVGISGRPSGLGVCRSATTWPSTSRATSSAWSSMSGLAVVTTVVRPSRCRRSRSAIRASVCASTADVGSTSTRMSGSVTSARVSTSRCRWPPENDRPRSSTSVSSPSSSASITSSADAVAIAVSRSSSLAVPRTSSSSRSGPLNKVALLSLTTIARRTKSRSRSDRDTPPSSAGPSANRPIRSAIAAESSGTSATTAVSRPGCTRRPDRTSTSSSSVDADFGLRDVLRLRLDRDDPADPPCGHEAADQLVDDLGAGAQRDHQEGRVAVEGHQLTGADRALDREPRADPDHDHHEEAGQEDLQRVEQGLEAGHPDSGRAAPAATPRRSGGGRPPRRRCRGAPAARRRCRRRAC